MIAFYIILGIAAYLGIGLILTGIGTYFFAPIACENGIQIAVWSVLWPLYLLAIVICLVISTFIISGSCLERYARWLNTNQKSVMVMDKSSHSSYY